jgi:serine/threonine protein kinase/CRP-like cAMP-binding protein
VAGKKQDAVCDEVRATRYDFTDFIPPSFRKSEIQRNLILNVIERSFVFAEFRKYGKARSEGALDALIDAFEPLVLPKTHILMNQGEKKDNGQFYIVEEGKVDFQKDGKFVSHIDEVGASFGELALLYNVASEKAVSVHESGETSLLTIEQKVFRGTLHAYSKRAAQEKRDALLGVDFLHDLVIENEYLTHRLLSIMIREELTLDQSFNISQDRTFVVIQSGEMHAANIESILCPGDYFGSQALIGSLPRQSTNKIDLVARSEKVVFFRIDNHAMGQIIGPSRLQNLTDMRRFANTQLVKKANLSNDTYDLLSETISEEKFDEESENIWKVDECDPPALYVVREGFLVVSSHDESTGKDVEALVNVGSIFGHDQLKLSTKNEILRYNRIGGLKVSSPEGQSASIGILSLSDVKPGSKEAKISPTDVMDAGISFPSTTKKSIEDTVQKETREREPCESDSSTLQIRDKTREIVHSNISVEDLEKIRLLGEGEFGEVWLVAANVVREGNPGARKKFALKSQLKVHESRGDDATDAILKEIEIMQELTHSQLVDLITNYDDDTSIHMLMELVPYGELWERIHVEDERGNWSSGLHEDHAKFYAMSIADTLNFMHSKGIIYRDLKPENVLIDADGYPVIADFGFAKFCPDKTYTFVGTPKYVAPEIITNAGQNRCVDFWAFGVTVYEMVTGENPFFFEGMDQISLFDTICREKYYPLPEDRNEQLVDFIDKLLKKDPNKRLGMLVGGIKDILQHQWFDGLDLKQVQAKLFPAPWKPTQLIDDEFETMTLEKTVPSCDETLSLDESVDSLSSQEISGGEESQTSLGSKSKNMKGNKSKKSMNESVGSLSTLERGDREKCQASPGLKSKMMKGKKSKKYMIDSVGSLSSLEVEDIVENTSSLGSKSKIMKGKKSKKSVLHESVGSLSTLQIGDGEESTSSPSSKSKISKGKKRSKKSKKKANSSSMNNISYSNPDEFQFITPEYMLPPDRDPTIRRSQKAMKQSELRRSLLKSSFDNFGILDEDIF